VSIARLCRRRCTVRYHQSGPATDGHNTPEDEWTEVETRCALQQTPGGRREDEGLGDLSQTTWSGFFLPTIDPPRAADQLTVDGQTYQFRGDAALVYRERTARPTHIEANLVRAE